MVLSYLDVNMSYRLHLHVMMKCAYIHDDIIGHALHSVWDYGLIPLLYQACTHTPRPGIKSVKMGSSIKVWLAQTKGKGKGNGHFV